MLIALNFYCLVESGPGPIFLNVMIVTFWLPASLIILHLPVHNIKTGFAQKSKQIKLWRSISVGGLSPFSPVVFIPFGFLPLIIRLYLSNFFFLFVVAHQSQQHGRVTEFFVCLFK